jgi:O-acetyl-ADP-ribose deacetylase (regulator of RNase III)
MYITIMYITFNTKDFEVYLFDRNDTELPLVNKNTSEDIVGSLTTTDCRVALVSSANSLGFMDGGSDLGYMNAIPRIQALVQNGFKTSSELGRPYLHIGNTMAFFLPDNNDVVFISAPTMFLPQKVNGTENQYYAFVSALRLAKQLQVKKVFCPMMCTGLHMKIHLN